MVDVETRNEDMLTPQFHPNDLEIEFNEDVEKLRKSLHLLDTYIDPFLEQPVPNRVAKWHGYPEPMHYPPQNYTHNRFTDPANRTNFDELTPFRARQLAVEYARAQNAEWMPRHVAQAMHDQQRRPYDQVGTLVGSLRKGYCDPDIVLQMQPALSILGSCVDLLETIVLDDDAADDDENDHEDGDSEGSGGIILRFHYHGLMKNKFGMKCWTETLLQEECGMMNVNNVIFETGFRKRDFAYEGGDKWFGPAS